ncbi:MAG: hypothetical protein IJW43_02985 [Clostridia bacterium]|nr:hypothetical protein [Clostridia bacterium]
MINIIKKNKDLFPVLIALLFMTILAVNKDFSAFTIDGIKMYFYFLLPSLFPYFFLVTILSLLKGVGKLSKLFSPISSRLFKVNGACGYAYFMSLIAGYPIGASLIADFKNSRLISSVEAERGSVLCSTSSPAYLISTVGAIMFESVIFGAVLFLCHLLSSITIGIIFSFYKKDKPTLLTSFSAKKTDEILFDGITGAVNSTLFVGAIITLFYILTEILYSLGLLNLPINILTAIFKDQNVSLAIVFALFENGKGMKFLSSLGTNRLSFVLSCFLCGFSGLSIILQSVVYLKRAKIKIAPFILSKIMVAIINLVYGLILAFIFF